MEKLIFANGCFDLLHDGHMALLNFARSLGDRLIVAINSDASVRRLKGVNRPIDCQDERREMLLALRSVDEVRIFEEDSPYELIKNLRPAIIVKGSDTLLDVGNISNIPGSDIADVVIFQNKSESSTTKRIERIGLKSLEERRRDKLRHSAHLDQLNAHVRDGQ